MKQVQDTQNILLWSGFTYPDVGNVGGYQLDKSTQSFSI